MRGILTRSKRNLRRYFRAPRGAAWERKPFSLVYSTNAVLLLRRSHIIYGDLGLSNANIDIGIFTYTHPQKAGTPRLQASICFVARPYRLLQFSVRADAHRVVSRLSVSD